MSDQTPPPPAPQYNPPPPAPQYGEYAPAAPATPPPPAVQTPQYSYVPQETQVPQAAVAPEKPKSRTWDVVLTVILLVLGLVGALLGVSTGFSLPVAMDEVYRTYGLGSYVDDGSTSVPGTIIWVSHLVLYLIVLGISIAMLVMRKVTFWVALTGGVIAAIIYWATLLTLIFADPRLVDVLSNPQTTM
jgi:hypothetical protein